MFQKLDQSIFSKSIQRAGVAKQVTASQQLVVIEQVFKERFGEGVALHAKPQYIKQRMLNVSVAHPAVCDEIRKQEVSLIGECNERIGYPAIIRIQFSIPRNTEEEAR